MSPYLAGWRQATLGTCLIRRDIPHMTVVPSHSGGKYWQSLKQAWQAMFQSSSLRGYIGLMNASSERLVDVLAGKAKAGEPVEIWRLFGCLTMEIVCSTAFGCASWLPPFSHYAFRVVAPAKALYGRH